MINCPSATFLIFTLEFLSLASFMNINISNVDILLEGVTNCMQAFWHASMNQLQSMKCDSRGFNKILLDGFKRKH